MEMKLLDLHTGNYLELGKDFYYGVGNVFLTNLCDGMFFIDMIEKKDFIQAKPHTDPIVNRLAEKVGAVVYGGRYVLLQKHQAYYTITEKNDGTFMIGNISPAKKQYHIFEEYSKQLRNEPNKFEELYNLICITLGVKC